MAVVATVAVDLQANSAGFVSGLGKADAELAAIGRKWDGRLDKINSGFASLGKSLAPIAAGFSAVAVVNFIQSSIEAARSLGDLSQQIGVSAQNLQVYQYAAAQAGTGTKELETGLAYLTRTIGKAANGEKTAIDAFNRLGVGVLDAGGAVRSTDDVFQDIAEVISRMPDPARKAAAAVALFGESGQKLIPILDQGAAGLSEFERQAQAAGVVLTDEMIAQAKDAADKMDALGLSLKRAGQAAAINFAPLVSKAATALALLLSQDPKGDFVKKYAAYGDAAYGMITADNASPPATENPSAEYSYEFGSTSNHNPQPTGTGDSAAKKIASVNEQLAFQEAQLSRTSREQAIYQALQQAGVSIGSREGQFIAEAAGRLYDKTEAAEKAAHALRDLNAESEREIAQNAARYEARQSINKSVEQEISDTERLIEALNVSEQEYERVSALLNLANQYRKAGIELTPEEVSGLEEYADRLGDVRSRMNKLKDETESAKKLGSDLGMTFGSAFEDAVIEAGKLSDVLQGLAEDIARLILRMSVTQPLATSFSGLFSSVVGSLFGGSGTTVYASTDDVGPYLSQMNQYASGTDSAPPGMAWVGEQGPELVKFRGGEQIYPSGLSDRLAAAWNSIPGYADGAFSTRQLIPNSAIGAGEINVNIINNAGADVSAGQKQNSAGGIDLEVVVDRSVAKSISQRGSASNKAIRRNFGATETLAKR